MGWGEEERDGGGRPAGVGARSEPNRAEGRRLRTRTLGHPGRALVPRAADPLVGSARARGRETHHAPVQVRDPPVRRPLPEMPRRRRPVLAEAAPELPVLLLRGDRARRGPRVPPGGRPSRRGGGLGGAAPGLGTAGGGGG